MSPAGGRVGDWGGGQGGGKLVFAQGCTVDPDTSYNRNNLIETPKQKASFPPTQTQNTPNPAQAWPTYAASMVLPFLKRWRA